MKAAVTFETSSRAGDGEERTRFAATGEYLLQDGVGLLRYTEPNGAAVRVRLTKTRAAFLREGEVRSRFVLETCAPRDYVCETAAGDLTLPLTAERVDIRLSEGGGSLDAAYTLGPPGERSAHTVRLRFTADEKGILP